MKTLIFFRRRGLFVTLVVLTGLLLSSAWLQAQTFADQLSRKTGPEIRAQLQGLDREVAAKGYTFKVGESEAMEASIEELCGLVIPDPLPSSPPIVSAPARSDAVCFRLAGCGPGRQHSGQEPGGLRRLLGLWDGRPARNCHQFAVRKDGKPFGAVPHLLQ